MNKCEDDPLIMKALEDIRSIKTKKIATKDNIDRQINDLEMLSKSVKRNKREEFDVFKSKLKSSSKMVESEIDVMSNIEHCIVSSCKKKK